MRATTHGTTKLLAGALAMLLASPGLRAQTGDPLSLRARQEAQQRARTLARDLVSGVLDAQLQQLEENGLQGLPIYRDVKGLRDSLSGPVDAEMARIVDVLVKAQEGGGEERGRRFNEAREAIRAVVLRLTIERHHLLRRLKSAELAAQAKRLIDAETGALGVTSALPEQPKERQESAIVAAVEDQRDVKALFLKLIDALADVATWGGPESAGAADGIRILKAGGVREHIDSACRALESADFTAAADRQRRALNGLRSLLERIEESQGLIGSDREAALATVRGLVKREENLRESTRAAELSGPAAEKLAGEQLAVHAELGKLDDSVAKLQAAPGLLEAARAAAFEASGKIFDADRDGALNEEAQVIASLGEIERALSSAPAPADSAKTAEDHARRVNALDEARADLEAARAEHSRAEQEAPSSATAAARHELEAARRAARAAEGRQLPSAVSSRIGEASDAARQAAATLADESAPSDRKRAALESASEAFDGAMGEIDSARGDAARSRLAVEIGELARAAESLERAAAAVRDAAARSTDAADAAKSAAKTRAAANEIARKTAEGVRSTAPVASRALEAALDDGDASASELSAAATNLRGEIADDARELMQASDARLAEVAPPRKAVEQILSQDPSPIAERMAKLLEARAKTADAALEEERARGRPAAASARRVGARIERTLETADAADRAATALAEGKAGTTLDAVALEQRVADEAEEAAKDAASRPGAAPSGTPDALVSPLEAARDAAARAARATLDGDASSAKLAREEARAALAKARAASDTEERRAAGAPPGAPDLPAQATAGRLASDAAQLAAEDAPRAGESLDQAARYSADAERRAQAGDAAGASAAQGLVASQLGTASVQLQGAIDELARSESSSLAAQGDQAGALAARAAPIDPGAAAALRSARAASERESKRLESKTARPVEAAGAVESQLERALASLRSREERARRDREVAESVRDAAADQESAARAIDKSRETLESLPPAEPPPPEAATAVQALDDAEERFARAQTALGQGAEQVSGQSQVANVPIREALRIASGLPGPAKSSPGSSDAESAGSEMGSGFVPPSPDATARRMAGAQALARSAASPPDAKPGPGSSRDRGEGQAQGQGQGQGEEPDSRPGDASSASSEGGGSKKAASAPGGPGGGGEAGAGAGAAPRDAPWLLKLPPQIREAIRAQSQRPPPRGYEERLRRYFESLDS